MDWVIILGYVAGALTTLATIPQVIKTVRSRKTEDVSLGMYSMVSLGVLLWIIYAFIIMSYPLILTNIITFILVFTMLIFKLKYR